MQITRPIATLSSPKRTKGADLSALVQTCTTVPDTEDLAVLRDSTRVTVKALRIGISALIIGMTRPIATAKRVAVIAGKNVESSCVALNTFLSIRQIVGHAHIYPARIDGMTKARACVNIMQTKPLQLRPSMRITPVSNILVSVLFISSEQISKVEIDANTNTRRPKIWLRKPIAREYLLIFSSSGLAFATS